MNQRKEELVFKNKIGTWQYAYTDERGLNQHSRQFQTEQEARDDLASQTKEGWEKVDEKQFIKLLVEYNEGKSVETYGHKGQEIRQMLYFIQQSIKEAEQRVVMETITGETSDGYHTFNELYDHRITLFIALCKIRASHKLAPTEVWRSKRHSNGELCFGTGTQFVLGIYTQKGKQITYHIPVERWEETNFAETLEKAPEWDGHSSEDVLKRLKNFY